VRPTCLRCLRPAAACVCEGLPKIPSRTRVVILQHPREARLAICSAWLTRIALENASLHRGVRFDDDPEVRAAAAIPGAAVLFPGDAALPVDAAAAAPPPVLFAIDGTWHQAARLLDRNPALAALPRISVHAGRPGGYGDLRREPAEGHLATIEAVALALGALERDPARFEPMLEAFRRMVEAQLACARGERRNPRHRGGQRTG
jgi:DTW domain-containing protein YfiP